MGRLIHDIASGFAELLYPTRCIICDRPGCLICQRCWNNFAWIEQKTACLSCGAPFGVILCTECWHRDGRVEYFFDAARSAMVFDELGSKLIRAYKDLGERRLSAMLAYILEKSIPPDWLDRVDRICCIPATKEAIRKRGFDHMRFIVDELSANIGIPFADVLYKGDTVDQRGLGREERLHNMNKAIKIGKFNRVGFNSILLIDDVFTTGSTLNAATAVLKSVGVKEVFVLTAARVC